MILSDEKRKKENIARKVADSSWTFEGWIRPYFVYFLKYNTCEMDSSKFSSLAPFLQVNKVAELEGKVTQLTAKVFEYRNQVESQKKELKIAHKVITYSTKVSSVSKAFDLDFIFGC